MYSRHLRLYMNRVEQCVDRAARYCQTHGDIEPELKHCLAQLEQRSDEMKAMVESLHSLSIEEEYVRVRADELKDVSHRALQTCKRAAVVAPELRLALQQTHEELSRLERSLH